MARPAYIVTTSPDGNTLTFALRPSWIAVAIGLVVFLSGAYFFAYGLGVEGIEVLKGSGEAGSYAGYNGPASRTGTFGRASVLCSWGRCWPWVGRGS